MKIGDMVRMCHLPVNGRMGFVTMITSDQIGVIVEVLWLDGDGVNRIPVHCIEKVEVQSENR